MRSRHLYYVVGNPVNHYDSGFFSKPMNNTQASLLLSLNGTLELFTDENNAREYATSNSHLARPPKTSGRILPVYTVELDITLNAADRKTDAGRDYYEISADAIRANIISAEFPGTQLHTVDFDYQPKSKCTIM